MGKKTTPSNRELQSQNDTRNMDNLLARHGSREPAINERQKEPKLGEK